MFRYSLDVSREFAVIYGIAILIASCVLGQIYYMSGFPSELAGGNVLFSAAINAGALAVALSVAGILWTDNGQQVALMDGLLLAVLYVYACLHAGFAGLVSPALFLVPMTRELWPLLLFMVVGIPLIHLAAGLIMRWRHRGEPPEGTPHPMSWK